MYTAVDKSTALKKSINSANIKHKYERIKVSLIAMMYFTIVVLLSLTSSLITVSGDNPPDTRVQSCVYTFNVPPTENVCPPGSRDVSSGDIDNLKQTIESHQSEITDMIKNLTSLLVELTGPQGNQGGRQSDGFKSGTHYTRWGHSECPSTAELLYSGKIIMNWF